MIASNNHSEAILPYCEDTLSYLLEKLDFIKLEPKNILVIGPVALKGKMLAALNLRYPEAQYDFLSQHIRDYPVKADHYGLIFCHWLQPMDLLPDDMADNALATYELLFYLLHHFLKADGLLLFSYMGPETTLECLSAAELTEVVQPPMPALGDMLLKLDFLDPVLDRDRLPYEQGCLELAYGHAWKKPAAERCFSRPDKEGTVFMPMSQIQHLEMVD